MDPNRNLWIGVGRDVTGTGNSFAWTVPGRGQCVPWDWSACCGGEWSKCCELDSECCYTYGGTVQV